MISRTSFLASAVAGALAVAAAAGTISAQAAPQASAVPAVGQPAPDFALTGATRYGVLASPVRLSDYRGKTVVLAFFFRARTKG
ncbi:MAG: redoxin domain-containing protein [Gemmatimonadaceae bacterium]